jgi:protein PhnA
MMSCELCGSNENLNQHTVAPDGAKSILICDKCARQIEKKEELDATHWTCLKDSMWSENPTVQVVAWRMLNRLKNETWAADAIDMMYLEDDMMEYAKATNDHLESDGDGMHRDCNGAILMAGDSVTLIKSLDVKGSSVQAKIGTAVRNIKLVHDNTEQIEGKIDGQQIVILTKYVKKS